MPGPQRPGNPTPINGATIHGILGQRGMRHRWELPLLGFAVALALLEHPLCALSALHKLLGLLDADRPLEAQLNDCLAALGQAEIGQAAVHDPVRIVDLAVTQQMDDR